MRDFRAGRKRTFRARCRIPAAVPAGPARGRRRTSRPGRPARARRYRTFRRKRRPRAAADRLPSPARSARASIRSCRARCGRIRGSPPARCHLHRHRPGVRIADLEGLRLLTGLDDLVARGKDRHTRPAVDRRALAADHRQQRDLGKAQPPPRGKHDAAVPGFDPCALKFSPL